MFLRPAFSQILAPIMKPYMTLSIYSEMTTNHARSKAPEPKSSWAMTYAFSKHTPKPRGLRAAHRLGLTNQYPQVH